MYLSSFSTPSQSRLTFEEGIIAAPQALPSGTQQPLARTRAYDHDQWADFLSNPTAQRPTSAGVRPGSGRRNRQEAGQHPTFRPQFGKSTHTTATQDDLPAEASTPSREQTPIQSDEEELWRWVFERRERAARHVRFSDNRSATAEAENDTSQELDLAQQTRTTLQRQIAGVAPRTLSRLSQESRPTAQRNLGPLFEQIYLNRAENRPTPGIVHRAPGEVLSTPAVAVAAASSRPRQTGERFETHADSEKGTFGHAALRFGVRPPAAQNDPQTPPGSPKAGDPALTQGSPATPPKQIQRPNPNPVPPGAPQRPQRPDYPGA